MSSRVLDPNVRLLYQATFLFGMACGISISLTALHLDANGYTETNIGWLAAIFATGIVLFSLPAGALIRRFSAKRTLIASLLCYTVCVTAFPFLPSFESIAPVRFIDGASSVGIWVASETILLSRTRNEDKAHFTSLYAIFLSSGYVLGPIVANGLVLVAPMRLSFVASGIFALTAVVYLAIRLERDAPERAEPTPQAAEPGEKPSSGLAILRSIKTSCFATFAYGYFQASVVLFLPLYLMKSKGIAREQTIVLPALFALGMLVFSNPAGRIADRFGRLRVMSALAFVGTLMILGFVYLDSYVVMCAAVIMAGATLAAITPVSLALQGVIVEKRNYSRSNAIYNVFYAAGMLAGPPISSQIIKRYGATEMLFHLAALWAAFVVFTLVFYADDPAVAKGRLAAPNV
ncbi:MAG TPA: MFS transporter [Polyangiaceae bacterium]|nr:MFS transporter [Polyangiaceae bacterium]